MTSVTQDAECTWGEKVPAVFVTWQNHRRTETLSHVLGLELVVISTTLKSRLLKYWPLIFRTWSYIARTRPRLLFVQNPSIVLAAVAGIIGRAYGSIVVVDRHSNFAQHPSRLHHPIWILFRFVSDWTLRVADLTIVTNPELANIVEKKRGRAVVLPDKIPSLSKPETFAKRADERFSVVFICTFADDEPVDEVIEAAAILGDRYLIRVTGRPDRYLSSRDTSRPIPDNVEFLGFVPDDEYSALLANADVIMPLTTLEYCLNCGAYEAVSVGVPLIMADTLSIRRYFSMGVEYTALNGLAIAEAIRRAQNGQTRLNNEIRQLRTALERDWQEKRLKLQSRIEAI